MKTPWQRMWASPWFYMFFFVWALWDFSVNQGLYEVISFALVIFWGWQVLHHADRKWGRRDS